jgi:hypothetical protein
MQIKTVPDKGAPFVTGMNAGTQIVPKDGLWYLFNREFNYTSPSPQCRNGIARIVARKSTDRGKTWSDEVVIATPDAAKHECEIADGQAFWDADTKTWHYLAQMLDANGVWNLDHFTRQGADPMGAFVADEANPVVRSHQLRQKICGPKKSCPENTARRGHARDQFQVQGILLRDVSRRPHRRRDTAAD